MSKFTLELGDKVKSIVTGFKGMVTSRADHLNGCNRYWVEPQINKDGEHVEGRWFDEPELKRTHKSKLKRSQPKRGGPSSSVK